MLVILRVPPVGCVGWRVVLGIRLIMACTCTQLLLGVFAVGVVVLRDEKGEHDERAQVRWNVFNFPNNQTQNRKRKLLFTFASTSKSHNSR